ncbi:hypothetical protein GCM10023238_38380 [Streptomyces heliomycini]
MASALVELGVVPTVSDAFTRTGWPTAGRAFMEKHETDPFEVCGCSRTRAGSPSSRTPAASKRGRTVPESAIAELAGAGFDGIEVDHMDHDPKTRARLRGLAKELGLLVTGSSDYHAGRKTCVLGEFTTDPEVYGEITRRATGRSVPGAAEPETPAPSRTSSLFVSFPSKAVMLDVAVFGSLFLTLFVIMDPPGITPIFLALTAGRPAEDAEADGLPGRLLWPVA